MSTGRVALALGVPSRVKSLVAGNTVEPRAGLGSRERIQCD